MGSTRTFKAIGLAFILALVLAPSALASTFTKVGDTLVFSDAADKSTSLTFALDCHFTDSDCLYDRWLIQEEDDGPADLQRTLDVPAGCERVLRFDDSPEPEQVYCPIDSFDSVEANMGDRDDTFDGPTVREFRPGTETLTPVYDMAVDLGAGDDSAATGIGGDLIEGGDGEDRIVSSRRYFQDQESPEAGDTVDAGPGADSVDTGAGPDIVAMGDSISPDDDFQLVDTYAGDDVVTSGAGRTSIDTAEGEDTVTGGSGRDFVSGGSENDTLEGNGGDDTLDGEAGIDSIDGGAGNNSLGGGPDDDTLVNGNDGGSLDGDAGNDTLTGGSGPDDASGGEGDDVINAGDGDNSGFDLSGSDEITAGSGNDSFSSAGPGDDLVRLNGGNDNYNGGEGNDDIDVAAGDDSASGDIGNDTILGGDGVDEIDGEAGNDIVDGQGGDDGDDNSDNTGYVAGGDGADTVRGGDGDDLVAGGDTGGDEAQVGNDDVSGGNGNDSTEFFSVDLRVNVSLDDQPNDTRLSSTGQALEADNYRADIENLYGSGNSDELIGNDSANVINGSSGADRIFGRGGDDGIGGLSGNDFINGEGGNDTLFGGDDDDDITGGDGDDRLEGNARGDVLTGGAGQDTYYGDTPNNFEAVGNDTINAQDGLNEPISCGPGSDTAFVDAGDQVPNSVTEACEIVSRLAPPPDQNQGGNNTGGGGGGGGGTPQPPVDTKGPDFTIPAANKSLRASKSGVVSFKLGKVAENTTGTLQLKTDGRVKVGKKRKVLALGSKAIQALTGQSPTIKVKLSAAGRKLLRQKKRIKVQANVTLRDAAGNATIKSFKFTVRPAKK